MMDHAERVLQRRNTRALIDADPVDVEIFRSTTTETAGGGTRKSTPSGLGRKQRFRLAPASMFTNLTQMMAAQIEGMVPRQEWVILGRHDADIRKDDLLQINGVPYKVFFVDPKREYQTLARVHQEGKVA